MKLSRSSGVGEYQMFRRQEGGLWRTACPTRAEWKDSPYNEAGPHESADEGREALQAETEETDGGHADGVIERRQEIPVATGEQPARFEIWMCVEAAQEDEQDLIHGP